MRRCCAGESGVDGASPDGSTWSVARGEFRRGVECGAGVAPGSIEETGRAEMAPANSCMIHGPQYDCDDRLLPAGARYRASLLEQEFRLD